MTAHTGRKFIPAAPRGQYIDDGFQRLSGVGRRTAAPCPGRNVGLELTPLGAGDFVGHGTFRVMKFRRNAGGGVLKRIRPEFFLRQERAKILTIYASPLFP